MTEVKNRTVGTVHVHIGSNNKAKVGINNTIVEVNPYEFYKGSYTFASSTVNQTIETKEKILEDNITILKIPTYEVANETGIGFYIGGTG